jgi:hypothetical protein
MPETKNTKLVTRCITLAVLSLGLFLLTKDSTKASLASRQGRPKPPSASAARQDDAPLRIINTFVESEPGVFRLKVMAQNQSGKRIRAYAIVAFAGVQSRVIFANLTTPATVFQPTQIKTFDLPYGENEAPGLVTLSIDFVEFEDGSTWGRDMYNAHDKLAGQREGAKAERERLRELLKSKGPSAVFDAVRAEVSDDLPPTSETTTKHSEEWRLGYSNGVALIRHRLRETVQADDAASAERALSRPVDLSESKPQ